MPIQQVIIMLRATKPADAANVLLSMTSDRIQVLMTELDPVDIARILDGAKDPQKLGLVLAIPAAGRLAVLRLLPLPRLVALLCVLPPEPAAGLLATVPPRVAAELFTELPAEVRRPLPDLLEPLQPVEFWSVLYERRAAEAVVEAARRVSWLDERAGELQAEVFGKLLHIAVRYVPETPLSGAQVAEAANRADWRGIVGLMVLSNLTPAESARAEAEALTRAGRPVEVLRWFDQNDDGVFKRALVRMTS
jgi:hypothetical protein